MGKRDYAISEFYIKYNDIDKKEQVSSFQTDSGQKIKNLYKSDNGDSIISRFKNDNLSLIIANVYAPTDHDTNYFNQIKLRMFDP